MRDSFQSVLKYKNLAHRHVRGRPLETPPTRRVAFVLLEHFSMMAFTGAVDALVTANLMARSKRYEVTVVGAESELVTSDLGIATAADLSLADLDPHWLDMLIVCGGLRVALQGSARLRTKLCAAEAAGVTLGGLWNGALFLAEAGLMDAQPCAMHPDSRAAMAELFPRVPLSPHSYVLGQGRISCAGANSSLGMMLEVIRRENDDAFVAAIEEVLSCDKAKDVLDVSVLSLDRDPTLPQALKSALTLMHNNIDEPLSVDEIAAGVALSRRQLERLFRRHVQAAPSRYYLELRLTHARQLLSQSNRSIADIAVATGFASIAHFRACFRQFFQMTPGKFRRQPARHADVHDPEG